MTLHLAARQQHLPATLAAELLRVHDVPCVVTSRRQLQGATLGFDATGGGELTSQILAAMEVAANRAAGGAKPGQRYGSDVSQQPHRSCLPACPPFSRPCRAGACLYSTERIACRTSLHRLDLRSPMQIAIDMDVDVDVGVHTTVQTFKQVYIYGGLDTSETRLNRSYGMRWGVVRPSSVVIIAPTSFPFLPFPFRFRVLSFSFPSLIRSLAACLWFPPWIVSRKQRTKRDAVWCFHSDGLGSIAPARRAKSGSR